MLFVELARDYCCFRGGPHSGQLAISLDTRLAAGFSTSLDFLSTRLDNLDLLRRPSSHPPPANHFTFKHELHGKAPKSSKSCFDFQTLICAYGPKLTNIGGCRVANERVRGS